MELIINSRDRVSGTPEDYVVQLPYGGSIHSKNKVSLRAAVVKNSIHVINSTNNLFWCSIRQYNQTNPAVDNLFSVTIPAGTYPYSVLVDKLNTLIPEALTRDHPSLGPITVDTIHNEYDQRFEVQVTSTFGRGNLSGGYYHWFAVCDESYDGVITGGFANSANNLMGYTTQIYPPTSFGAQYQTAAANVAAASQMDDILGDASLYLCSDLVGGGVQIASGEYTAAQVLGHVPLPSFGRTGVYEANDPLLHPVTQGSISRIRIYWLNSKLIRPDMQHAEHTIVLRFE